MVQTWKCGHGEGNPILDQVSTVTRSLLISLYMRKILFSFLSVHVFLWIQSLHSGVSFWECNILIEIYFCPNATFHIRRLFWRSYFYINNYECKISSKYLLEWNVSTRIFAMSSSFRVILLKVQHFQTKIFWFRSAMFQIRLLLWGVRKLNYFL